ncbi:hypothetical protein GCM10020331_002920 [Ectobacillus funiculus]
MVGSSLTYEKDIYEESFPSESVWTLKKNSITEIQQEGGRAPTLVQVWKESVNLLNESLDPNLMENFEIAIDLIEKNQVMSIFWVVDRTKQLHYIFEQLLGEFYSKIGQLSHDTEVIYDRIFTI